MEDRVTELEVKVVYLERAHEELSEVVRDLYEKVAALTRQLQGLREQAGSPADPARTLEDDKPPHY